jgi:hypothetical protein
MCFGGGKSYPAPTPAAPQPGVVNVDKVAGDPSQAAAFQGTRPPPNLTGRAGGELLLDAANKAPKTTLG